MKKGSLVPTLISQTHGDVVVVHFQDAQILDEVKIQQISDELNEIADRVASGKLLLNFSDVKFMSSAVLGKLNNLNKKCKSNGTSLKLSNISPDIMQVFKITKLNKVFSIYESEEEALAAFNKKGWFSRG